MDDPRAAETMIKGIFNFFTHLCLMLSTSKTIKAMISGNNAIMPIHTYRMIKPS